MRWSHQRNLVSTGNLELSFLQFTADAIKTSSKLKDKFGPIFSSHKIDQTQERRIFKIFPDCFENDPKSWYTPRPALKFIYPDLEFPFSFHTERCFC